MFTDDNPDEDVLEHGQKQFAEKLYREEGVLVEPDSHEVACDPEAAACAPDDYVSDPYADGEPTPGTIDDVPVTYGEQLPEPGDEHLVLEGPTRRAGRPAGEDEDRDELGTPDERELWARQKALLEEDETAGLKLEGFPEDEVPSILDAMGDDAAEALPDSPNGTSATGFGTEPDHGGFPERNE